MEGAESGVVLRAGFLEAHVFADDLEDVRLLLYGLGEVVGHGGAVGSGLQRAYVLQQFSADKINLKFGVVLTSNESTYGEDVCFECSDAQGVVGDALQAP